MITTGLQRIGLAACLLFWAASARAATMTYDFSGTISQPFDGSTQISGSITYDTDLEPYPGISYYPGWSYYDAAPDSPTEPYVSMTFTFGGVTSSSVGPLTGLEVIVTDAQGYDGFYIEATYSYNLLFTFALLNDNLLQPPPFSSTAVPASLSLASYSMGGQFNLYEEDPPSGQEPGIGYLASLVPASAVPEPTSIVTAMAGIGAAIAYSRIRRRL